MFCEISLLCYLNFQINTIIVIMEWTLYFVTWETPNFSFLLLLIIFFIYLTSQFQFPIFPLLLYLNFLLTPAIYSSLPDRASSPLISKAKQAWAWLILGWESWVFLMETLSFISVIYWNGRLRWLAIRIGLSYLPMASTVRCYFFR